MLWRLFIRKKKKISVEDLETPVTAQEKALAEALKSSLGQQQSEEPEKPKSPKAAEREELKKKKKELKDKQREERKAERGEKRNKVLQTIKEKLLFYIVCAIFFCTLYFAPITFAQLFGKEIVLYGSVSKGNDTYGYQITYDFEQNLENIYPETKAGDKIPLNKMLWGEDVTSPIEIINVYREEGRFVTELPHKIGLGDKTYGDYLDLRRPSRVKLTLKITSLKQVIKYLELDDGGGEK